MLFKEDATDRLITCGLWAEHLDGSLNVSRMREGKFQRKRLKPEVKESLQFVQTKKNNEEKMNVHQLLTAASMEGKQTSARRQAATDVTSSFSLRRIALR